MFKLGSPVAVLALEVDRCDLWSRSQDGGFLGAQKAHTASWCGLCCCADNILFINGSLLCLLASAHKLAGMSPSGTSFVCRSQQTEQTTIYSVTFCLVSQNKVQCRWLLLQVLLLHALVLRLLSAAYQTPSLGCRQRYTTGCAKDYSGRGVWTRCQLAVDDGC